MNGQVLISREQAATNLTEKGLSQVDQYIWMGYHAVSGRLFQVFVRLAPVCVEVQVRLGLFSRCDQANLYRYFSEVNSRVAVGKFALGQEQGEAGRPLILCAEMPAGPEETYTSDVSLALLLRIAFSLLEEHYGRVEELFRQGCGGAAPPPPGGGQEQEIPGGEEGGNILDRIQVPHGERPNRNERGGGKNA